MLGVRKQPHESEWIDRGWYLVTEFEKSSSINFQKAVTLAQTHPGFIQLMDERNVLIYRNIYREHDIRQFQQLYGIVKNWKGTRLYFKGDETSYDAIESGVRCYIKTKLEYRTEHEQAEERKGVRKEEGDGCKTFTPHRLETLNSLGCIGCRRSGVGLEWPPDPASDRPPWFFYGRLDRHSVYNLNKEELHQSVYGNLILYASCPLLDLEQISQFVSSLPDRIDPRKDREWEYRKSGHDNVPFRFHRIPEVLPKNPEAYCMYLKRVL
jgi:hypothetical protein